MLEQNRVTSKQIRNQNLDLVRHVLHDMQVGTISMIKDRTNLSVVTINKLMQILIDKEEVIEGDVTKLESGRPAITYRFNQLHKLILIVSCYKRGGHEYAGYSVHDLFGLCIERREELLKTIHTDEFKIGIERYLDRYDKIAIIGISMPSDSIGGRVASAIRKDPQSKRLAHYLSQKFKNIPVFFETDINAATLGCYKRHTRHQFISGIILVPGRAPSCGFCYQGELIRGCDGMAGEVRYFPMYNDVGVLPEDPQQADELAIRTLRAVMCVLNPSLVVVYTESLKPGIYERLEKVLGSEAETALLPKISINSKIKDDIESGMVTLCLQNLSKRLID